MNGSTDSIAVGVRWALSRFNVAVKLPASKPLPIAGSVGAAVGVVARSAERTLFWRPWCASDAAVAVTLSFRDAERVRQRALDAPSRNFGLCAREARA